MSSADKLSRERIEAKRDAEEMAAIDTLRKRMEGAGLSNGEIHKRVLDAYGSTNSKSTPDTRMRLAEEALGLPPLVTAVSSPAPKRTRKAVPTPKAPTEPAQDAESAAEGTRVITQRGKR